MPSNDVPQDQQMSNVSSTSDWHFGHSHMVVCSDLAYLGCASIRLSYHMKLASTGQKSPSALEIDPWFIYAIHSQFSRSCCRTQPREWPTRRMSTTSLLRSTTAGKPPRSSSVKLDAKPLNAMVERISNGTYKNIHSVLIVKDDKLVFEEVLPAPDSAIVASKP